MQELTFTTEEILANFYYWLDGDDPPYLLRLPEFQQVLAESTEILPDEYCQKLSMVPGTTVGHALRCMVPFPFTDDGKELRLDLKVRFASEQDSLEWWRATEGKKRWQFSHDTDGTWDIKIAGYTEA